jgi:phosphate acyltransferase
MRIVVDAMGSDARPTPDVAGAVLAARESQDTIILVGPEDAIKKELRKHQTTGLKLEVVNADDVINMDDKPGAIGKDKPNSSMHVGMNMVKDGAADAFVTAGNTGAAYAIAMVFSLRRIPKVKRPALSSIFPIYDRPVIFLDVGANADAKPEWLAQFAVMGNIYAHKALGLKNPRVGILSNGAEDIKGNRLVQESSALLRELPINFIGNIEPQDLVNDCVDVVITDGFTGNIFLKTFETSARFVGETIRRELKGDILSMIGAFLSRPAFRRSQHKFDTSEIGGAPLLGVNGVVIVGHGQSNARTIRNAVRQARNAVEGQVIETMRESFSQL